MEPSLNQEDYGYAEVEHKEDAVSIRCRCGKMYDPEKHGARCPDCHGRPQRGDARDFTPAPPVLLDPRSVLRNRERTRKMLATGDFTWPRPV